VAGGLLLLAALGAQRCIIAVKTDMPEARVALYDAIKAAGDPRVVMSVVTAKYPAGGERQLIELVLGKEVPAGGHPADAGVLCQNVATAAAAADFFLQGQPLISRIVTVSGGCVSQPRNIEARIGTPMADLITLAGGYRQAPRRLIMGGPMMGVALASDELPITGGTNCLIAATAAELGGPELAGDQQEMPCIRCGDCIEACPARLLPQELLFAARAGNRAELATLGVAECIECGACDYVCPSHIPLTQHFVRAKAALVAT
jgi:electron transport complex protein RnfC